MSPPFHVNSKNSRESFWPRFLAKAGSIFPVHPGRGQAAGYRLRIGSKLLYRSLPSHLHRCESHLQGIGSVLHPRWEIESTIAMKVTARRWRRAGAKSPAVSRLPQFKWLLIVCGWPPAQFWLPAVPPIICHCQNDGAKRARPLSGSSQSASLSDSARGVDTPIVAFRPLRISAIPPH